MSAVVLQDIQSCYPFQLNIDKKRTLVFIGDSSEINFISAAKSFLTRTKEVGLREVSYYVDDDSGTEEEGLVMREAMVTGDVDVFSDDRGFIVELDPNVKKISFRYFIASDSLTSESSDTEEGKWLDKWDSMDTSMEVPIEVEGDDLQEQIQQYTQRYFPRAIEVTIEVEVKKGKFVELVTMPSLIIPVKTGQHFSNKLYRKR